MKLCAITKTVRDAIAADGLFSNDAADTVFEDYGNVNAQRGEALDLDNGSAKKGYFIAVWPPARGSSHQDMSGIAQNEVAVVVRFEVNPKVLPADPSQWSQWFTSRLQAIIESVLGIAPEINGTRFQMAPEAFELMNFDEGLIAYHVRFLRPVTFGT